MEFIRAGEFFSPLLFIEPRMTFFNLQRNLLREIMNDEVCDILLPVHHVCVCGVLLESVCAYIFKASGRIIVVENEKRRQQHTDNNHLFAILTIPH
jgi:hypothetical protein